MLIAELQTAGRGRRQRSWIAPTAAGLTLSVLLDLQDVPAGRLGWVGIVGGLSLAAAVRRVAAVDAVLKWPNDVLVGGAKIAGLLATASGNGSVVLGAGLNVSLTVDELPRPDATSLLLAGATELNRDLLAARYLDDLAGWLDRWRSGGWDPSAVGLRDEYRARCVTLGRTVRAELPDGTVLTGLAVDVDDDGALLIDTTVGRRTLTVADVQHVTALPTEPAEPAEPAEPTEPTEPSEPTEPIGPTEGLTR